MRLRSAIADLRRQASDVQLHIGESILPAGVMDLAPLVSLAPRNDENYVIPASFLIAGFIDDVASS